MAIRVGAGAVAASILLSSPSLVGCAAPPKTVQPEPVVVAPPPSPPEPVLASAADAHLTLFGELPDKSRVPFSARAASPMKQHSFASEGADFDVDVSPDGKWLAFSSTRNSPQPDIYVKTIDGQAVTQVTSDPAADVQPCFSPDGKWLAYASNRSGNWDIWMVNLQGGQSTQVTHSPQHEVHPSLAPDGKRMVYCLFNDRSAAWELWTLHVEQPGARKMIGQGLFPRWSPRGDSILYQRARQRGGRWFSIWKLDLENGEPKFPVEVVASSEMALIQPTWSPDGGWIAYGTARLGATESDLPSQNEAPATRGDIWMIRSDGSASLQLTQGEDANFGPAWGIDGRVYFSSRQTGEETIWSVKPLSGGGMEATVAVEDTSPMARPVQAAAAR